LTLFWDTVVVLVLSEVTCWENPAFQTHLVMRLFRELQNFLRLLSRFPKILFVFFQRNYRTFFLPEF